MLVFFFVRKILKRKQGILNGNKVVTECILTQAS